MASSTSLPDPLLSSNSRRRPGTLILERHRAWAISGVCFAVLAAVWLSMTGVDERTLNGVSVWNKPFKFALSTAIYFASLAWFARLLEPGYFATLAGRILTWLPIVCAAVEVAYISIQGALGQASHFNTSTPFHSAMYSVMAVGAIGLIGVCAWLAVLVFVRHGRRDVYAFGVALGLMMTCLLGGGFGVYLGGQENHWVEASRSDADGLWLFNWSNDGGDLRVAHFFGIHAMQIVPLIAHAVRSNSRGVAIVSMVAVAYAVFATATFVQAVQGRPFM